MQKVETGYVYRPQFLPLHRRKRRFFAMCCHRRAGKTVAIVNDLIDSALRCEKPNPRFAYIAPYYGQAKDVAWAYLKQYALPVPGAKANESELRVDFPSGARVRLYGADNARGLRGIYLDGVALDEYGDINPTVFPGVIRPSLADRGGWAMFAGTSRGKNHFADMMETAKSHSEWDWLMLKASESGILPPDELQSLRDGMSDEQYQAELECSFSGSVIGAYFGKEIQAAEDAGRIGSVPYQPEVAVDTWWDLGMADETAIWFTQNIGREIHVIDYYAESGTGLVGAAKAIQGKGYVYGTHNAPHDIQVREWSGAGRSRIETAAGLGIRFAIVPNLPVQDGIDAARSFIARCWFDRVKTADGRAGLTNYRKTWDDKRKVFSSTPYHDWSSNPADAFRYLAVGHKTAVAARNKAPVRRVSGGGMGWMG